MKPNKTSLERHRSEQQSSSKIDEKSPLLKQPLLTINEDAPENPEKNELENVQNESLNDGSRYKKQTSELSLLDIGKQAFNWDKGSKKGEHNSSVDGGVAATTDSKDEFSRAHSHKVTQGAGAKLIFCIMAYLAIAQMM